MTLKSKHFIAIIGSFDRLKDSKENAKKFAENLGAQLAEADLGIMVFLAKEFERCIVCGYIDKLKKIKGEEKLKKIQKKTERPIQVRYITKQQGKVGFCEEKNMPKAFNTDQPIPIEDWEVPFYNTLVKAKDIDGVLIMAGGNTTLTAAQIAIALGLPILAIDGFDGTSQKVRNQLALNAVGFDYPSNSKNKNVKEGISWLKEECVKRTKETEQRNKNEDACLKFFSQTHKTKYLGVSLFTLFLMIALFFIFFDSWGGIFNLLISVVGLGVAGATGAGVRIVVDDSTDMVPISSIIVGGVAGLIVGLVYLIPLLLGGQGVRVPENLFYEAYKFLSAIVTAFLAGLGSDIVFKQMLSHAKDLPTKLQ
ncbi:hypothetical protein QA601_07840 [Chitinispirillales bacterium ANBcel5]|uniref:hypothetical protein n=1 Tax=Cellulosispirillum alkaliphilum TaxID=3039283 RepID=UPI002A54028F|nr:hypothetical protein [Chitinispirillales bacterium ANBcel5]